MLRCHMNPDQMFNSNDLSAPFNRISTIQKNVSERVSLSDFLSDFFHRIFLIDEQREREREREGPLFFANQFSLR